MGLMDFFKKKKENKEPDPLSGLTLDTLKKGYYLDYDMKTWEVLASNTYDWGDNDITYEWQLQCHDDTFFLEMENDDDMLWSLSRKVALRKLDPGIITQLKNGEDAPDTLPFEGKLFYLEATGGGHFHADGAEEGREMIQWCYEDDDGTRFLTIEQWGETDFELSLGKKVEEYQFSDILPSGKTDI
ncbi:MAG: DUF4178 domain-containing protein [Desulfobacterium sp.]